MLKKLCLLGIILVFSFILISCKGRNEINVPPEDGIEYNELEYFEFINDENPVIEIKVKDYGTMYAQLFPEVAKNTVNNFINYIQKNEYSNSTFHRIIENFMIQGGIVKNSDKAINGDFLANGFQNPLKHSRGVFSMARTNIANSATSQFFIVHKNSPHLDGQYASFGALVSGFNVLDAIATTTNWNDQPINKIVIESITVDLNGYIVEPVIYA